MILINGERKQVDDIIEEFKIKHLLPSKDKVTFEQVKTKIDILNGGRIMYSNKNLPKTFVSVHPETGQSIEVQQTKSAFRFNPKTQQQETTDRKYTISKASFSLSMAKDKELIVFLILSPHCEDSPLAPIDSRPIYRIQNLEKKAKEQNQLNKQKAIGISLIYSEDIDTDKLREVAAGMNVSGTVDMSKEELQSALYKQLEANPDTFMNNWESSIIALRGLIQVAIDKGILVYKQKNGVYRWFLNEDEVCIVGAHEDSRAALESSIKEAINTWIKPLKKAVEGKVQTYDDGSVARAMNDTGDVTTLDKLNLCIQQDVIQFDRASNTVYSIRAGEYHDELAKITDKANWKQEVVSKIESGELDDFVQGRYLSACKKQKKELENANNA